MGNLIHMNVILQMEPVSFANWGYSSGFWERNGASTFFRLIFQWAFLFCIRVFQHLERNLLKWIQDQSYPLFCEIIKEMSFEFEKRNLKTYTNLFIISSTVVISSISSWKLGNEPNCFLPRLRRFFLKIRVCKSFWRKNSLIKTMSACCIWQYFLKSDDKTILMACHSFSALTAYSNSFFPVNIKFPFTFCKSAGYKIFQWYWFPMNHKM